jgi:cytochrome c-type biogenesis protein CcmH
MSNKNHIVVAVFFLLNLFISNSYTIEPDEVLKNPQQEIRARNIFKNIRCVVCQNQSIDDSAAPLARDLRILIRNKIKMGESNKKIYEFLTNRYGDFILLKPPFKINTLALWILPIIFFVIGFLVILIHNKKSKKNRNI